MDIEQQRFLPIRRCVLAARRARLRAKSGMELMLMDLNGPATHMTTPVRSELQPGGTSSL
jgi:hypothetical protein